MLSRAGETTRGYDRSRILQMTGIEEDDTQIVEILLQNSDGALTSIDFEFYQADVYRGYNTGVSRSIWVANTVYLIGDIRTPITLNGFQYRCTTGGTSDGSEPTFPTDLGVTVTEAGGVVWEMDGNTGEEYSHMAPLKVDAQELRDSDTYQDCRLYCIGIPNQMAQDKAEEKYTQTSDDTNTVKTLFTAIAQKTLAPYINYTSFTVVYDSEDSIIDSYKPKDYFSVEINENRLSKGIELLGYTGNKMRAESDGKIHVLTPITSGDSYAYKYELLVDTVHTFFNKAVRNRFVEPNREVVRSHPDHSPQYAGSSTSVTSFALAPKVHTTYRRVSSNSECLNIAIAKIEQYELNAERGSALVPMNCGQEVWDWILVTDGRQGDSRTGNVQRIEWTCRSPEADGKGAFNMLIRFGKVNTQGISAAPPLGFDPDFATRAFVIGLHNSQQDKLEEIREKQQEIIDYLIAGVVPKWHVEKQMIIPVWR